MNQLTARHKYSHEDKMRECIEFEILQQVEYSLNSGDVLSIKSNVLLADKISDNRSYSRKGKVWK